MVKILKLLMCSFQNIKVFEISTKIEWDIKFPKNFPQVKCSTLYPSYCATQLLILCKVPNRQFGTLANHSAPFHKFRTGLQPIDQSQGSMVRKFVSLNFRTWRKFFIFCLILFALRQKLRVRSKREWYFWKAWKFYYLACDYQKTNPIWASDLKKIKNKYIPHLGESRLFWEVEKNFYKL